MRVHARSFGPLQALESVLSCIESVRNARALYLLLCTFTLSGLLISALRLRAIADSPWPLALWIAAIFFAVFYGTFAAGLVLMDEALQRPPRSPLQALGDALLLGHRLWLVVLSVLAGALLPLAAVAGLLWLARWPALEGLAVRLAVGLGIPAIGGVALVLATLVGPLAAPACWSGWSVRRTLAFIWRQVRQRLVHAVLLSAAVSLITAAVAGLVSFLLLTGGRVVLGMAGPLFGLEIAPAPVFSALFGIGLRLPASAGPPGSQTLAAIDAASLVFALGLVVPGVVYLRGLCELFLALGRLDDEAPAADPAAAQPGTGPATSV